MGENTDALAYLEHNGRIYPRARASRRWLGRIIDAVLVVVITVAGTAVSITSGNIGTMILAFAGSYLGSAGVLGALYGWGIGIGQLVAGTKSRRSFGGHRVGGFRGWCRYWAIALLPVMIYMVLDAPTIWDDRIVVCTRQPLPAGARV